MTSSEYIANFFLVIIGFAVSELLRGSARLIRERHLIKFYWPAILVIPLVLEMMMFVFLKLFTEVSDRTDTDWSIDELIVTTLIVMPFAFASYLLFPSRIKEGFDMKKFFLENAKAILVIMMGQMLVVLILMITRSDWKAVIFQIITLALTALVLMKFEKLHVIVLITLAVLMNYFMFFFGPINI